MTLDARGERWVELERRLAAAPERVYRAWADPEELPRWFPYAIEGGLAVGIRSTLIWPDRREWWEVQEAAPPRLLVVRRPADPEGTLITTLTVRIEPQGLGSRVLLREGAFPIDERAGLDAWVAAIAMWAEAVAVLRGYLDFSVDLRSRW